MSTFEQTLEKAYGFGWGSHVAVLFTALCHKNLSIVNHIIAETSPTKVKALVEKFNAELGEIQIKLWIVDNDKATAIEILGIKELVKRTAVEWIEEYRNKFPKGILTGNRPVRGDKQGCLKKMNAFLKANPETTKEQIFEATDLYIQKSKANGYDRMTCADYFIEKNGASMLSSYLENLSDNTIKPYSNLREV